MTLKMTQPIGNLFTEQVKKTPNLLAVVSQKDKLTFQQLDEKANRLARHLQQLNFGSGDIIAIMSERSVNMIVGIMGILKAGGAYLPIDPSHPVKRNEKILQESRAVCLLTTQEFFENQVFSQHYLDNNQVIYFDQELSSDQVTSPDLVIQPEDLAYIIYTSGSTGEPKGVMIEHKNVVNLVNGLDKTILRTYGSSLNLAIVAPYVFDPSVQQIFSSLLLGHTLFIVPDDVRLNPKELIRFYNEYQIDISDGTPAHLKLLSHELYQTETKLRVRHFIIGGENLSTQVVTNFLSKFSNSKPNITNVYGPAECCVDSSSYLVNLTEIERLGFIPIGTPLPNVKIYILDNNFNPVGRGETGELFIAGQGMGRGYLARENLTAERFITNPFEQGQKFYKTGDLARWLDDGKIEFVGRYDRQIKLRGHRIELGEIESAIFRYRIPTRNNYHSLSLLKKTATVSVCEKCLLDSQYPGISLENGVCSICREYEKYEQNIQHYFKSPNDFVALMEDAKKKKLGLYDCLLLYSGGKDSTYVLYRLVEMGIKVLTLTFDNGFISETAFKNIQRITTKLSVDHMTVNTANMNQVFLESLKNDSTVCNGCFRSLTSISNQIAHKKRINVIITGLSRGQIFDTKLKRLFETGIYNPDMIEKQLLLHRKMYHSHDDKISRLLNIPFEESSLDQIYFVDYFRFDEISVADIKIYLAKRDELWKEPKDTGLCSTNCRINDVGILVHQTERGFHNYAAPLSWDVRLGILSKEEGFKELNGEVNLKTVEEILKQLDYKIKDKQSEIIDDVVVVLTQNISQKPTLCAYFVSDSEIDISKLRAYLLEELPEYMVPNEFVQMEALPLTINGKIDLDHLHVPKLDIERESLQDSPTNDTEKRLLSLWIDLLGRCDIGVNEDFFELGGDSISATILVSIIEEELGVKLSVIDAFKTPTIKQIAALIHGNPPKKSEQITEGLILLRSGTSEDKHFFLMHDVFGGVQSYLDLSQHFIAPINVWGILGNSLDKNVHQDFTIEELSSKYINKIQQIQQEGPYYLGGWSFGGILALEIALQLEKQGDKVALLAIIDSNAPTQKRWSELYHLCFYSFNQLFDQEYAIKGLSEHKDISCKTSYQWQMAINFIQESSCSVQAIKQHIPLEILEIIPRLQDIDKDELISYLKEVMSYINALSHYIPRKAVESPLLLFKAGNSQMDRINEWYAFLTNLINYQELDGNHFSILRHPNVEFLASKLNQVIRTDSLK